MGQAQWKLENVKCMMPVLLPVMPDSMLHLQMDATEDYSEFYQEIMENLVLRAENVCTIAQPEEPMPYVRHRACVRLLDVSHTWGVDDERSMIYVEHLCQWAVAWHVNGQCIPEVQPLRSGGCTCHVVVHDTRSFVLPNHRRFTRPRLEERVEAAREKWLLLTLRFLRQLVVRSCFDF